MTVEREENLELRDLRLEALSSCDIKFGDELRFGDLE